MWYKRYTHEEKKERGLSKRDGKWPRSHDKKGTSLINSEPK
jgi:hypothetical protein